MNSGGDWHLGKGDSHPYNIPIPQAPSFPKRPTGRCSGVVDPNRKGGSCSAISQDMVVVSGVGLADKRDPRGAWRLARR